MCGSVDSTSRSFTRSTTSGHAAWDAGPGRAGWPAGCDMSRAAGMPLPETSPMAMPILSVALGQEVEVVAADLPAGDAGPGHLEAGHHRFGRWAAGAPGWPGRSPAPAPAVRWPGRSSRPCFTAPVISLKLAARSPNSSSLGISMTVSRSPAATERGAPVQGVHRRRRCPR